MSVYRQKITVPFDFPVYFTREVFSPENPDFLEAVCREEPLRRHRLFVVIDRGVHEGWPGLTADIGRYVDRHGDRLTLVAVPLVVEGGEAVKNDPAAPARLHAQLNALGMDRQSHVVIIGGGAVLDMAGYAAATAHRGVRVVRVPTTVLAQDDAGLGVKNGINAFGKKNFLGTFAPPFAVLNDIRFLETLSPRDAIAGMAEAVKVALIRDAGFFDWLVAHAPPLATFDAEDLTYLIRRSAELHLTHIATSGDPFEFGSARPLDFGHWAAHKLEAMTHSRLRHGEAVAIGVALDTAYSVQAGLLDEGALEPVVGLLERLGLPLWDDALDLAGPDARPTVLDGLAEFREHLGGDLAVTFLRKIGEGVELHEVREEWMRQALAWLRRRGGAR